MSCCCCDYDEPTVGSALRDLLNALKRKFVIRERTTLEQHVDNELQKYFDKKLLSYVSELLGPLPQIAALKLLPENTGAKTIRFMKPREREGTDSGDLLGI